VSTSVGVGVMGERFRSTALGRAIVVVAVAAVAWALPRVGKGVQMTELASSWQLVDLGTLGDDPLGSVWYLHTQPPLYNLLVGLVVWLPLPIAGALFVLYMACLIVTGLLLQDLLAEPRGLGIHPTVAGAVAALAVVGPALLATIRLASYEVPVAMLLVAVVWAAQRYALSPGRGGWLVAVSALGTLACLTRSLLHPLWLVGALVLLVLAARPTRPPRRAVAAAVLLPLVLVGGWTIKNQALFDEPTLSSWRGFNAQRGVVAPMERDEVEQDVAAGAVSPLATRHPWGRLDDYADVAEPCTPRHDHPAVTEATKQFGDVEDVANFNHECYLPLYRQADDDARTLARRHPGRYVRTRASALTMSALAVEICVDRPCTWMDRLYRPLLVRVDAEIPVGDWNLPRLGLEHETLPVRPSLTLAVAMAFVLARGAWATVRLVRRPRRWGRDRDGDPDPDGALDSDLDGGGDGDLHRNLATELIWALAAWTTAWVVLAGDLLEIGENGRFRATIDPLLVALPLAAVLLAGRRLVQSRRGDGRDAPDGGDGWDGRDDPPALRADGGLHRVRAGR
jgi:hypothetical protein